MIQDPPDNEMRKAEQNALSKVFISARRVGLLPPYIRGIMPRIEAGQNRTPIFSWLYDNFVHHHPRIYLLVLSLLTFQISSSIGYLF